MLQSKVDLVPFVVQSHSSSRPPQSSSGVRLTAHTRGSISPSNFIKRRSSRAIMITPIDQRLYHSLLRLSTQIGRLLAEIPPDDSRDRRTMDTILRTHRFYRPVNARSPTEVDEFPRDRNHGAYVPPYGFFDRPRMLHKLGVASRVRFERYTDLGDLDKSIELNQEALHLVPDGHDDRKCIVACLGSSFLRRLEARGELSDVDMSADLVEPGESCYSARCYDDTTRWNAARNRRTSRANRTYVSGRHRPPMRHTGGFINAYPRGPRLD